MTGKLTRKTITLGAALTRYIDTRAAGALDLGQALLGSIEARTKVIFGQRKPQTDEISKLDYQMVTCRSSQ